MADTKPKKQPKKMTRRGFVACGATAAGLVGVTAAVNVGANMFKSAIDHYIGGGETTITNAPGSENWDTTYYDQQYRGRGRATEEAKQIVVEIEGEGIVLLKNTEGALPLASGTEVSLIGRFAADPVYGGAGSGTVDPNDCVTLHDGIAAAGLTINETAYNWIAENYGNYDKANITMDNPNTATYYIGEIPWADYSSEAQGSISGTTALVVIGRGGGEGGDLSQDLLGTMNDGKHAAFVENSETANYEEGQHELELSKEERDLITAAKDACDKVIVLYNGSTPMELAPLMSGELEVDAIVAIGSLGASGATAVGQVLTGVINPSGKTTDIWAADFTADPTFGNFGGKRYTDVTNYYAHNYNGSVEDATAYFVEYKEGIYYGYRYYETAAAEAEAGNYPGFDYDEAVLFPFGYGLSYTTFDQVLDSCESDGETVSASVTVTNTGSVAGKCVVELYYSAPYAAGGIEKSAVVLGAFGKTALLDPGASETVELSFPVRQMASWSSDEGGYVLDEGDYVISLRSDSHTVIAEQVVALEAQTFKTDSATGNELANRFDDLTEYMRANCENLSRADFAGTWPAAAQDRTAAECGITLEEYDYKQHLGDEPMPTTGANNGVSLIDLRGRAYDDELWEQLLDELTVDDMTTMLNDCAYNTPAIAHIGKPATSEPDGPAGFTSLTGATGNCAYCSEFVMAQTWNTELMYRTGQMVGQEALASGYNGWYAPAMNTHRSPFAGRNFEYYSEDPLLAGRIGAAVVSGAASNGCYAMVKHYAMNDQESYRIQHLCTWATEQTAREIYLRPFEITIKEASTEMKYISDDQGTVETVEMPGCTALMSSFNYVGTQWAGGSHALCTEVPRGEWGFTGCIITDFNLYGYMDKNWALDGGTDLHLTYAAMTPAFQGTGEASVVARLREASHRVLYTVVNSNAMQGMAPGSTITTSPAPWQYAVWGGSAVLLAGAAALGARCYLGARRNKEIEAAEKGEAASKS
ncbi:glycoside hydrolase family 3 protein [Thermophilibacter provencensis]|uniref:Glycoside hydrolase family 3 C-terminal domain-containing protein n=1 Tax=Thermophilibacter provencensis TaxID=1852386 RepID=A0ABT7V3R9_9ACTN|nr:glycoside hydrolase family 3 protein [Thermophilibacter provencensis]MDM8270651.1 glycoside hydrolase family 3 C-terminal domain-containing protein [Thermophilibacter provencensis]